MGTTLDHQCVCVTGWLSTHIVYRIDFWRVFRAIETATWRWITTVTQRSFYIQGLCRLDGDCMPKSLVDSVSNHFRAQHLSILLPAPIPISEVESFDVATSTAVAVALTDDFNNLEST